MADPVMKLNKLVGDLGLATLAIAGCLVAFTGAASANSVTLSQSGGVGPSSYAVSSSFTVTVFANLGPTGGGQFAISVSLDYDPSVITATACAEAPGLQFVGGSTYFPATENCGVGNPADGGLLTAGTVFGIEQHAFVGGGGVSGTLILGTVTFHAKVPSANSIIASTLGEGGPPAPGAGGGFWAPFTTNCGTGSPGDGGLLTAVGLVHLVE